MNSTLDRFLLGVSGSAYLVSCTIPYSHPIDARAQSSLRMDIGDAKFVGDNMQSLPEGSGYTHLGQVDYEVTNLKKFRRDFSNMVGTGLSYNLVPVRMSKKEIMKLREDYSVRNYNPEKMTPKTATLPYGKGYRGSN